MTRGRGCPRPWRRSGGASPPGSALCRVRVPRQPTSRHLALRLAVEPFIDRLGDAAKIVDQRRRVRIERPEDEAAIAVDAWHLRDVEFRILEVTGVAVRPRHRAQLAGIEIAPSVIRAR